MPASTSRPRSTTRGRSASGARLGSCVITLVVRPAISLRSGCATRRAAGAFGPAVGSSTTRTGAARSIAREWAMRRSRPPERAAVPDATGVS
ncbi:hypothetical protein [Streptomyces sp. H51]|uniref:hypothetical protein n=1 Tax=Streptomyces sp. H51 TaxID=3111770 RepID=UPI002D774D52|nr:hypothetical protein [Streptomyces sp. H51]